MALPIRSFYGVIREYNVSRVRQQFNTAYIVNKQTTNECRAGICCARSSRKRSLIPLISSASVTARGFPLFRRVLHRDVCLRRARGSDGDSVADTRGRGIFTQPARSTDSRAARLDRLLLADGGGMPPTSL